ncbi:sulfhydryl oxidase 1-like [Elgaria multicarinata webbii]|uniref:sulfhydryl oxidase 1-like n=1 Tax=Elgaria multicarinata webbii TaxID=159646 RepID=UPI002FCD216E
MLRWLSRARPGLPPPACLLLLAASVSLLLPLSQPCGFIQYQPHDLAKVLDADTLQANIFFSRSAWVIQFYAHWCIDTVAIAPTWRALAKDIKDWRPTVKLGVIDCGEMSNKKICSNFGITNYPTLMFFEPFATFSRQGIKINETGVDLKSLKEAIITLVESHEKAFWSEDAPSLKPISAAESIGSLKFQESNVALIFEEENSLLGKEVILDLSQLGNITMKRVLKGDEKIASGCDVSTFPSLFLLPSKDSCVPILSGDISRTNFVNQLLNLPGVYRKISFTDPEPPSAEPPINHTLWKVANKSKIYMADLESAVFCSLRQIELRYPFLDKETFDTLKSYVNVLDKYFPAYSVVKNDLHKLDDWLKGRRNVSRSDWTAALTSLKEVVGETDTRTWVGCQGSNTLFRGYPCSLWTLFHFLTVQEGLPNNKELEPSEALSTLRKFMNNFYGCPKCVRHFEKMASESMNEVKSTDEAILWLWSKHNNVNFRLKDDASNDPEFPKIQWPPNNLCPLCHETDGDYPWNNLTVLEFFKKHFSVDNISMDFRD